ncbi:L,D-transpeptidase family protein [Nonomuraea sp. LPB2021202275-12-8]|uniref:L,D-transpeptidase family protein n=1 Tax=Nonomuraea sp. LPB2021202275-12-8 TaxID=3120159 RepID=UPI00300C6D89
MSNVHRTLVLALGLGLPVVPCVAVADTTQPETVLLPGDRGESVERLQRRLRDGGYFWGHVSGKYDQATSAAVLSFQKTQGIRPHVEVGAAMWRALEHPRRPRPLLSGGARDRVEIDLRRQLLVVYRDRRPVLITHMSSGAGVRFCNSGYCRTATTPTGDFRVTHRTPGWTSGPLGSMYNSLYFVGGVAMHGSSKVPLRPSSHGCVRVPMSAADRLYHLVGVGEPVHVRGNPPAPVRAARRYAQRL